MQKNENKRELIQNHKFFKGIKGILVIEARHLGRRHGKLCMVNKPYYWRVDKGTHHIKYAQVGHIATVQDKGQHHAVVIIKRLHPTVPGAVKMAKHLNYVYNFYNNVLENGKVVPDQS